MAHLNVKNSEKTPFFTVFTFYSFKFLFYLQVEKRILLMTRAIESTLVPMTHGIAYETILPLFPYYSFFGNVQGEAQSEAVAASGCAHMRTRGSSR